MDLTISFGSIATCFILMGVIPQSIKILSAKSAKDVAGLSLPMYASFSVAHVCLILHNIPLEVWANIATSTAMLIANITAIIKVQTLRSKSSP